ncbi:anaphase-promoting complex subunit 7 [Anabrus simplex]|uniref:anaphase-promoting complex subunit 7 n=1 Tax=Anabrus simplex TaxID=316456 RepID=UPI0034DD072E
MSGLFDQIKLLFDQQLYSNVVALANLVLSVSEQKTDTLTVTNKFQTYVYYGDSLFHLGQYRKAEGMYRKALQYKKSLLKSKGSSKPSENPKELMPDIEIKYQIHLCHVNLKQSHQAIVVLQSIPGKQRNAKINMALAKLYQQGGMERSAITSYKEVLRECPLALEAAEGLLSLGVKGVEVNSLILEGATCISQMDWLNSWIKAHAHMHSREYPQAISTFRHLDECSELQNNISVLVSLGECYYYSGDHKNALIVLQRAHAQDRYMQRGLDVLAALLAKERRHKEMEKLVSPGITVAEYGPETWIAMAYFLYATKRNSKAAYFAQKACFLSPRNVEALILKGAILLDLKKFQDAVVHFREAMQVSPHRYEPHLGLVDCYVAMHRLREALTIASNACKQLGQSPRALTLYASVLMKDPVSVCKAKSILEKALIQDEKYLPAVYLLAEIYEQEMMLESAITLLEKQVVLQPTCKLHQMLGDLLARIHEEERALDHYSIALNMDPNNRRALEGLHRIDNSSNKLDSSYYMTVGEDDNGDPAYERIADSENEGEADESETEAVWSDMDLELASQ